MSGLSATEAVQETDHRIHDVGSAFMLHPETMARAGEQGYADPFAFYFAGRGGVLGDVDASVVVAAMGWFAPDMVRTLWDEGVTVAGAREGARRYGAACAAWGRDHLTGLDSVERLASLAEQLVAGTEPSGLPLFAGWRAEPLVDDAPGRAMQLIHVLREWRGGLHLVATTAAGLSPLEAILTNEGAAQARFFGWQGDFPDCRHLQSRFEDAQQRTNTLAAAIYERSLTEAERAELAELMRAAEFAVTAG
jgi:hypothetical protein